MKDPPRGMKDAPRGTIMRAAENNINQYQVLPIGLVDGRWVEPQQPPRDEPGSTTSGAVVERRELRVPAEQLLPRRVSAEPRRARTRGPRTTSRCACSATSVSGRSRNWSSTASGSSCISGETAGSRAAVAAVASAGGESPARSAVAHALASARLMLIKQ